MAIIQMQISPVEAKAIFLDADYFTFELRSFYDNAIAGVNIGHG
ncbi:MAG: hypothetical protein ACRCYP_04915 [Alphaproteobacteria bacterium]